MGAGVGRMSATCTDSPPPGAQAPPPSFPTCGPSLLPATPGSGAFLLWGHQTRSASSPPVSRRPRGHRAGPARGFRQGGEVGGPAAQVSTCPRDLQAGPQATPMTPPPPAHARKVQESEAAPRGVSHAVLPGSPTHQSSKKRDGQQSNFVHMQWVAF